MVISEGTGHEQVQHMLRRHGVPEPVALPRFEVNVFWHRRAHRDAGNRWLRDLLVQCFAEAATRA